MKKLFVIVVLFVVLLICCQPEQQQKVQALPNDGWEIIGETHNCVIKRKKLLNTGGVGYHWVYWTGCGYGFNSSVAIQ